MDFKDIEFIGRYKIKKDRVYLAFSGCGMEFRIQPTDKICSVNLSFLSHLNDYDCQFVSIFINDKFSKTYKFKEGQENISLDLSSYQEEIRIKLIKESEVYLSSLYLLSIIVDGGRILEKKKVSRKRVGFFGDSLTCGFGLAKRYAPEFTMDSEFFTKAFPYLVANRLNLDYRVIARSGISVACKIYCDLLFEEIIQTIDMYQFYPLEDDLDLAIVNLGTNDRNAFLLLDEKKKIDALNLFKDKYLDLLKMILKHNKDIKILICYNLAKMDSDFSDIYKKIKTEINKEYPKACYLVKLESDNSGASNHPYYLAHQKAATRIVKKIKEYNLI